MDAPIVALAPNPGIMTGPGTNQYLLGVRAPILIDIAPLDAENSRRLAATGAPPVQLLLTHIHPDHLGGALALRARDHIPIAVHRRRAAYAIGSQPLAPETLVDDGLELLWEGGRLLAIHTPGHESGHVCWLEPDRGWLFTGDTILGTGTTVIPPPDGDMAAYFASLRRLAALRALTRIFPGHGPPIDDPYERIAAYLAHRELRERQILDGLAPGGTAAGELVPRLYAEVPAVLHPTAAATVEAHLAKLLAEGRVRDLGEGRFCRAGQS